MTLLLIAIVAAVIWTVVMAVAVRHAADDDAFIDRLNDTEGDG